MNNKLQPVIQMPQAPQSPADFGQQLVQALGIIAYTQQEILNRLPTGQPMMSGIVEDVPDFPIYGTQKQKYNWFYHHGLFYNLDKTRKRINVTVEDIEEHNKFLNEYWDTFCR